MSERSDFWRCPHSEFDETYIEETGDVFEQYMCGHPDADINEIDWCDHVVKLYPPCDLHLGDGCAFPDVWKRDAA